MTISIWISKFEAAIKFTEVKEEDNIELFKLCLEGKAANTQFDMEQDEETAEWILSEWLKKMKSHFEKVKVKLKKRDIFELASMTMEPEESMVDFNKKFKYFVRDMEETMYTKELFKKTYVDMLSKVDNIIWWNLAQSIGRDSLEELMKKSIKLSEIKMAANVKETEEEKKKTISEGKNYENSTEKNLDDLIFEFDKMQLLVQDSRPVKFFSSYTCYTCGEKENTSKYFKNEINKDKKKDVAENSKEMLAISSESASSVFSTEKIGHKRLRHQEKAPALL
ncbi:hypothetical protein AYI68_g8258 [Smittium mucronatum]|uniref:Uncharacterized protein n=1 Tax=Smittium mucronatum TaxID=133383 RepID=A0A1R0GLE4_9FUNG|nr:hypothetical protein AYI68_g8258 [Smittium mucronatum]